MHKKYLKFSKYKDYAVRKLFGRMHTTYSQCGEDLTLDYFQHGKEHGFYVDIGANDPREFSNTYYFYKKGWKGLVIEPNLTKLNQYKLFRPKDTRVHMAVGQKGEFTFFKFKEDPLNTMSEEVARSYEKMGHKIQKTEKVLCAPLLEILPKYMNEKGIKHIDLMSVDTEGQNFEVLQTNDWNAYRPTFLVVETAEFDKPDDESLEEKYNVFLAQHDYKKVANTAFNSIYKDVRK
jgi:FkbM family methyltransferase